MTEADWLACDDPERMLAVLQGLVPDRKMRLFVCACCRRVWDLLGDAGRLAVEATERFADGYKPRKELLRITVAAMAEADHPVVRNTPAKRAAALAAWCATGASSHSVNVRSAAEYARSASGTQEGAERKAQCIVLREVFGNPFRPVAVDPAWLTSTAIGLACAAYDERTLPSGELDPVRLSIFADALTDAGCADDAILSHLRSPGPHVRGCWALDLILGKS